MIEKKCENCNILFKTSLSRIKIGKGRFCSKRCKNEKQKGNLPWNTGKICPSLSEAKKGSKNPMWKGGVSKKESDKRYSKSPKGKIAKKKSSAKYRKKESSKEKMRLYAKKKTSWKYPF